MISASLNSRWTYLAGPLLALGLSLTACGQKEIHGRKYKPLQPAANITVTVEKAMNGKPISNAAVIFYASREGKDQGSLEVKTSPDGEAKIDIIEIGSHVRVQVIANGFSTYATEFDVPAEEKAVLVKMEKPKAQVSAYQDNDGKPAQRPIGVQEPPVLAKPKKVAPHDVPTGVLPSAPESGKTPQSSSPQ